MNLIQVGFDCWSNLDTNVRAGWIWMLILELDIASRFHCWSNLDMNVKVRYECKGYDITTKAELSGKRTHKFFCAISYCSYNTLVFTDLSFAKLFLETLINRRKLLLHGHTHDVSAPFLSLQELLLGHIYIYIYKIEPQFLYAFQF